MRSLQRKCGSSMHWLVSLLAIFSLGAANAAYRFSAFNIRNFDYDTRSSVPTDKGTLKSVLSEVKADLMSVEEIHNVSEFKSFITTNFPSHQVAITQCGGAHQQFLGLVYNTKKFKLLSFSEDSRLSTPHEVNSNSCNANSRPLAIGKFQDLVSKKIFVAMTVHLKAGSGNNNFQVRWAQYNLLKKIVEEQRAAGINDVVIMGDFNTTGYTLRDQDFTRFTQFLTTAKLNTSASKLKCSAYWWGGSDDNIESPSLLDHIVFSNEFLGNKAAPRFEALAHCKKVNCREAAPEELGASYVQVSDHCPIVAEF